MKNKVTYTFQYFNSTSANVYLWLASPPETRYQKIINEQKSLPVQENEDMIGNQISFYKIESGETMKASYEIELLSKTEDSLPELTQEEKNFFLRSTPMVCVNEEVRHIAFNVIRSETNPKEQTKLLFFYIVKHYNYKFPPKARGVTHFLKDKNGDCGEFSFLYAALCRAIGIPCRVMVGAFTGGKHQPHVWNEIYLEQEGWIPVDTSMAATVKKQFWRYIFSPIQTLSWKAYYGKTDNQRITFSIDTEHTPTPAYPKVSVQNRHIYNTFDIAGKSFIWGKDVVQQKIPYLQPIYFYYEDEQPLKDRTEHYVGLWSVHETGNKKLILLLRSVFGYSAFLLAMFYFVTKWEPLSILFPVPAFLFCLSFVIRKERVLFFSIATIFFGIILLMVSIGAISTIL
ncbi:transglutaminase-like domain-containing protein [Virgibacillus sp. AGTR]|uniref:transglutaminase-like domain-containing protein n=1 Tax=unclassified Virgibacillus TaxID=2620237 RepID=UPI000EF51A02|nr:MULTISPECIES: transglutaminase-like domain-containing protein [unclassified Virgibacillus]MCC2252448.1 transglutaminase-like domain-containing protein [Virgibacillus sp. AGTR]QRZ16582.1 transglutaminase domain-containing protein [Virgibacillus sp. AGTR]